MADLILYSEKLNPTVKYYDRKSGLKKDEMERMEEQSSTIYVGNLPFAIREAYLYSVFNECGPIKRIILGINGISREPAGFCFIEFYERESAIAAIQWTNGTMILGRKIVVNIDYGFKEGRQFGRGANGFQKSDEKRDFQDPDRPVPKGQRSGGSRYFDRRDRSASGNR